jgi:hypothetical protein
MEDSNREVRRYAPAKFVAYIVPKPSDVVSEPSEGIAAIPALCIRIFSCLEDQDFAKARTEASDDVSNSTT